MCTRFGCGQMFFMRSETAYCDTNSADPTYNLIWFVSGLKHLQSKDNYRAHILNCKMEIRLLLTSHCFGTLKNSPI